MSREPNEVLPWYEEAHAEFVGMIRQAQSTLGKIIPRKDLAEFERKWLDRCETEEEKSAFGNALKTWMLLREACRILQAKQEVGRSKFKKRKRRRKSR